MEYESTASADARARYIFDNGDDKFSDIAITRVVPSGNRVRVRVSARRERTIPLLRSRRAAARDDIHDAGVPDLRKGGGGWKLIREGNAFDDVAGAMVDAATPEERETLLAAEPELMGRQLLAAFARLGGAAAAGGDYARSVAIFEQLAELARQWRFQAGRRRSAPEHRQRLLLPAEVPGSVGGLRTPSGSGAERADEPGTAAALAGIATIEYSFAEYTEAFARYREALAIHEKTDDVAGVAFTSLRSATSCTCRETFSPQSAAYRRKPRPESHDDSVDGETRALEGLGRVYLAQGDYAGALEAFDLVRRESVCPIARDSGR